MKKIVVLVENIYEDLELWYPKVRLEEAGHQVTVAGPERGKTYFGKHGYPCKCDIPFEEAKSKDFDALVIPGGFSPDRLRRRKEVLSLTAEMDQEGKPIAFICHAGWVVISAKILKGRKATSVRAIKDDMENAGAIWLDEPCVVDGNLISSRTPADLPQFMQALLAQI
ncbi:MAG: General stress protein 18 [Chlamydiae bacterium]|nr:General stress protein 18 [Chlamydiota bacterium]